MTDPNATPSSQPPAPAVASPPPSRRRFFRWAAIATVVAALGAVVGLKAYAHGGAYAGWHRGSMHGPIDPAHLDQHLDRMLKHLYVEIDATEAQKQALGPIVKAAARDLLPMREQLADARRQAVTLLAQPTVDRAALESLRASQLKLAEDASRRLTQALADIADVLTPEQRKAIAEHLAHRHGFRG